MDLLRFEPIYQDRVWGGRSLENRLGRLLPPNRVIGESWELVDRPEAQSKIVGGDFDGKTLREVIEAETKAVMGPDWDAGKPFPILVKWLDCRERLSLQVHPPKDIAPDLGGEPKTENWFIAEAEPDAALLVGLKPGVTRDQLEAAIQNDTAEKLVNRIRVRAGDAMFVHSGRIHAIDAGNLILEIQQNSDTTYRVYDWGRKGLDGTPRELHVEKSLQSVDFEDTEPELKHATPQAMTLLAESDVFRLRYIPVRHDQPLALPAGQEPRILSVVEGSLIEKKTGTEVRRSSNILLPYDGDFEFVPLDVEAAVLITDRFV